MKIKHPTAPLILESSCGQVLLSIKGTFVADMAEQDLRPLTEEEIARGRQVGMAIGEGYCRPDRISVQVPVALSPMIAGWINDQLPALRDHAKPETEARKIREAKWEEERLAKKAEDDALIEKMNAEVADIRKKIPAGHVEVTVINKGDFDGYPMLDFRCEGIDLEWHQVNIVGAAHAIRPGAMGAFASRRVASISREDLEAARLAHAEKEASAKSAAAEKAKELTAPVPQDAVAAYVRCGGDPENLPDDIDDPDYWLVRRYAEAIEHQGLAPAASLKKLASHLRESAREESAQYSGEA
ncbi:MAG: hypothetical protein QM680_13430 [Luteolibacter sp.]